MYIPILSLYQVYTGRYRNPQNLASHVTQVQDHLSELQEGVFVAVAQARSKPPVIGKVLDVSEETFNILYWKGSWKKEWALWMNLGAPWVDALPKSCVILTDFKLDSNGRFRSETVKYLKQQYKELKSNTRD